MFKKLLTATVLVPAALIGLSSGASAHTPKVSHDCTAAGATLTVHLTQYEKGSTVTVNGVKSEFGTAEYDTTITLGDGTSAKTWTVVIDNRGDGMKKSDKFDSTFTDTVAACVAPVPTTTAPLEDKDLTPVVPPKVEYVNPAWPICMVPGKHLYNAHDPECVDTPEVFGSSLVVEREPAPVVLAFTGSEATERAVMAGALLTCGMACLLIGRRFGKVAA